MTRINLYNYRGQIYYYLRLRVYLLLSLGLLLSLALNLLIYSNYQVKILHQQTRNSFFSRKLRLIEPSLAPVYRYKSRRELLQQQLSSLRKIEIQRDDTVGMLQILDRIVPLQIYLTSLDWVAEQLKFAGVSTSPLYLAVFLERLRDKAGVFADTQLKVDNVVNSNAYHFEINTRLAREIVAQSDANN